MSLANLQALSGRPVEHAEENRRFHDLLAWASGNPLIGFMISSLHNITRNAPDDAEVVRSFNKDLDVHQITEHGIMEYQNTFIHKDTKKRMMHK